MLYNEPIVVPKKEEFLFHEKPYNEDIDIRAVAKIEDFYEKNGFIPKQDIKLLLDWLTYRARINITPPPDTPLESSFTGKCAIAQDFYDKLLTKMNFEIIKFNVGDILQTEPIHELTCIIIPINKEKEKKVFLLDPTFKQFCKTEENRFERYFEEPRWAVHLATPHPGYFLNLTEKGKNFANNLIRDGYFEITEDSLKTYLDAFSLYTTPKENYKQKEQLGKIHSTTISGNDYWNQILTKQHKKEQPTYHTDFNLDTPKEIVIREDSKWSNRIKNFFKRQEQTELNEMFSNTQNKISNYKKKP